MLDDEDFVSLRSDIEMIYTLTYSTERSLEYDDVKNAQSLCYLACEHINKLLEKLNTLYEKAMADA